MTLPGFFPPPRPDPAHEPASEPSASRASEPGWPPERADDSAPLPPAAEAVASDEPAEFDTSTKAPPSLTGLAPVLVAHPVLVSLAGPPDDVTVADLNLSQPSHDQLVDARARARLLAHRAQDPRLRMPGGAASPLVVAFSGPPEAGKAVAAGLVARAADAALWRFDLWSAIWQYGPDTAIALEDALAAQGGHLVVVYVDGASYLPASLGASSDLGEADRDVMRQVWSVLWRCDGVVVLDIDQRPAAANVVLPYLDAVVELPQLDAGVRARLVATAFPPGVEAPSDAELRGWAERVRLSDHSVQDVVSGALAHALREDGKLDRVTMCHVMKATAMEYHKLGRLITKADFGDELFALLELPDCP